MFITPHTSVALWITTRVADPVTAFFFALLSHFVLDIIPHGDEGLASHKETEKEKRLYLMKTASIDIVLAILLMYLFIIKNPSFNNWIVFSAVFGAWLPDLAWISIDTFKIKSLTWYARLHHRIHDLIGYHYSIVYGVPIQIIFTLFVIKITF